MWSCSEKHVIDLDLDITDLDLDIPDLTKTRSALVRTLQIVSQAMKLSGLESF